MATPVEVLRTSYGYTNHGQVDTMIYTDVTDPNVTWPDNRLEEYRYSYDKRGNITDETLINKYEKDDNGNPVTNTVNKEYTYDSLNRLIQTTVGTTDITKYTYDKVGNKLTEEKYDDTTLENTKTNAYNEFNQLTSTTMSVPGGTAQTIATYSYDDRGNQILAHKRDFGATTWYDTTYQYDRAGYMQKSVTEKPGGITETVGHYYNGMEQRIRKVVDQNTTKYVYTGTTVLFTADDNNDKITENILSPGGQIVASNRFDGIFNGNAFFFNQDIRNSTTAIINKDLEALKYYEYDEQGREEEKGNPNFINENTFTGAISEGGNIFYMNARFYDANTGRFLSQDSYSGNAYEPWSQHLYSYCGNNPTNFIDPTGHSQEEVDDEKVRRMNEYGRHYLEAQSFNVMDVTQDDLEDIIESDDIYNDELDLIHSKWNRANELNTTQLSDSDIDISINSMEYVEASNGQAFALYQTLIQMGLDASYEDVKACLYALGFLGIPGGLASVTLFEILDKYNDPLRYTDYTYCNNDMLKGSYLIANFTVDFDFDGPIGGHHNIYEGVIIIGPNVNYRNTGMGTIVVNPNNSIFWEKQGS